MTTRKETTLRSGLSVFRPWRMLPVLMVFFAGCEVASPDEEESQLYSSTPMIEIEVPEGFDFAVRVGQSLLVDLKTHEGTPYPGIKVEARLLDETLIATGFTNNEGETLLNFILPAGEVEAVVQAPAIGIKNSAHQVIFTGSPQTLSIR